MFDNMGIEMDFKFLLKINNISVMSNFFKE